MLTFFIFSAIGIIDTLYLIYHKIKGTDVACPFFPKEWCRTVQYSSWSKTFGIPNSYMGFLIYVFIFIATYWYVSMLGSLTPLYVLVTLGFLFSLYFMYVQGVILKAFCTWCVLSFINFAVMFVSLFFI